MTHGGDDEGVERNWIRHITPIVTASTVKTTVEEPTIIRIVWAGKFPTSPDKLSDDVDPI